MNFDHVIVAIFFPNRGFLGDKVAYEPIVRAINLQNNNRNTLGIECASDPISMMEFPIPPCATFVLHDFLFDNMELSTFVFSWLKMFRTAGIHTTFLYTVHTDLFMSKKDYTSVATAVDLWDQLRSFADHDIYPILKIPQGTEEKLKSKLRDYSLELCESYVTIHLRSLKRDNDRNLDVSKYIEIANQIIQQFNVKVVFIGKGDDLHLPQKPISRNKGNMIIDLRDKLDNVWETACLLKKARAHIGGDSGPTHLAAAVGTNIVFVERSSERYGPFTQSSKLVRLGKDASTINNISEALAKFILKRQSTNHCRETALKNKQNLNMLNAIFPENIQLNERLSRNININGAIKLYTSLSQYNISNREATMYNDLIEKQISKSIYVPMRVNDLLTCIPLLRKLPINGFSISNHFKANIIEYVDMIDDDVAKIGAANTVINNSGCWKAYNTDWMGAIQSLEEMTKLSGKCAVVYGEGNIAEAICYGLKKNFCDVIVCTRKIEQAKALWLKLGLDVYADLEEIAKYRADIFINATPLEFHREEDARIFTKLVPEAVKVILEVVYGTDITPLNLLANNRGCYYISGWKLFISQATHKINLFASALENNGQNSY